MKRSDLANTERITALGVFGGDAKLDGVLLRRFEWILGQLGKTGVFKRSTLGDTELMLDDIGGTDRFGNGVFDL